MSLCTRINYNIGHAFTTAKSYVGKGVSKIGHFTAGCAHRVFMLGNSLLGKKVLSLVGENVAEFGGYYGGAALAVPYGRRAGKGIGAFVGTSAATALACISARNVANYISLKTPRLSHSLQNFVYTSVFIMTAYFITSVCSDSLTELGTSVGEIVGETIAYYGNGIFFAFLAIKLMGSEEVLWEYSNMIRTYPVKTAVSMVGTAALSNKYPFLQTPGLQPFLELMVGSLIYNSIDIAELSLSACEGKLLDGMLPRQIKIISPEYFRTFLKKEADQLTDFFVEQGAVREAFPRMPLLSPFLADLIPIVQNVFKKGINGHFNTSPSFDLLAELSYQKTSDLIMRGVNLYFTMLMHCPEALNPVGKTSTFIEKGAAILQEQMNLNFLERVKQDYNQYRDPVEKGIELFFNADLKPYLHFAEQVIALSGHIDLIVEKLIESISVFELKICGFPLSGEQEKIKIQTFLKNEVVKIVSCMLLCASSPEPLNETEARLFYTNLLTILSDYYSSFFGNRMIKAITSFLNHQIHHSRFN